MLYVKDKNFISKENTVVTFGKFDGIHNGHRLLIEKLSELVTSRELR